ncbi:uncharacterized protein LOC132300117 [Cornus florida]|uniref:uncharacterized protein LOC132300117 n=1 Tax=Cornus florida TaxID=4283 RepID=UPI00289E949F|nr:uncharacterized protein LOC132300117 [Cornus florida]XP_059653070.1 uncharacterized protein LOC132300117 [Cornus florida]
MEKAIVNEEKDGKRKEDLLSLSEDIEVAGNNNRSKTLGKSVKSENVLMLSVMQSKTSESCIEDSFPQKIFSLDNRIPKHIVSLDEKFLRRCLELIYISASKATSFNISASLGSSKKGDLFNSWSSPKTSRHACDLGKIIIQCPLEAGTGNAVISPVGDWFVGKITGSKSMMNILESPLFRQFGALDSDIKFGRGNLIDVKKAIHSDFMNSPCGLNMSSSKKLDKETVDLGNHKHGSKPVHKRFVSVSSMNSTWSDQSSSSGSPATSQGMLQCTWKDGFPHYVFSVDDQREVYVANLFKAASPDDKVVDYIYTFHSRADKKKEHGARENESDLVGKMRVSTSFTLCPNNSEMMETEFVLYGSNDNCLEEMQTSCHILRKNKGFSKKMGEVFKTRHSTKKRSSSKFGGTSTILENSSRKPSQDLQINFDTVGTSNLSEILPPPNLELAAIVVKDHIRENRQKAGSGGWGLKFLKKVGIRQASASLAASVPSECCLRNTGDCSTSVDILVPAGFHGGPRTRNGGPSGLIERWRSGGCCDCGGWDIGCPLTVLHTRPSKNEDALPADMQGECKSFDLFTEGSDQDVPTMKIVNIHDDLHFVHFQPILSTLQSYSIAVAVLHTQTPALRPKLYKS